MEEDFVTKLLRNSGNSAPDQQNRGASGNTSATGPYQNLRVPEVSGLWDSTIDLSRTHDATTTKTAQVCSLVIFKHHYTIQRYWQKWVKLIIKVECSFKKMLNYKWYSYRKMHHIDAITELQRVSKLAMLVSISAVKRTKTELSSLEVLLQKNMFELLVYKSISN